MPRTVYITTPIYYVNDLPHIGHTYTTIVADALARYHRLRGDDVRFLTGTDEHGQKIQKSAAAKGVTPQQLADQVVENYLALWPALEVSHDDFIRTTQDRHKRGVAALYEQIRRVTPDAIYRGTYTGWYCTGCESFYTEGQLLNGGCPDTGHPGNPVEQVEEASWFFRLSAYAEPLLRLYDERPSFVQPESRLNEVRAFVKGGLKDLSISRSRSKVSWGIPFPGDPDQTVYVWFDALTNYISALGFGEAGDAPLYDRYWEPADDPATERVVLHLVGKDILRFHAVYWPAFLMAAGLPVPSTIFGHGWWLKDDAKMSKSLGNVVRPRPLLEDFGADALRWFLLREVPLGLDGSFSDEAVLERTNSDLANNIGNLFSRVVALVGKRPGAQVPRVEPLPDEILDPAAAAARAAYDAAFERRDPSAALRALTDWADALNKYLVRTEPWRRTGRDEECDRVLRTASDHLALLALRLHPAMPSAAARLSRMLGLGDPAEEARLGEDLLARPTRVVAGAAVHPGDAVFPRLDRKVVLAGATTSAASGAPQAAPAPAPERKEKMNDDKGEKKPTQGEQRPPQGEQIPAAAVPVPAGGAVPSPAASAAAPGAGLIEYDDFAKVRLRVAKVLVCEKHPNADKLLRLEVDLGDEKRQIVAGIASAYRPEDLVGRTIIVVANLKPAKLRGLESQGMLLAATGPDGVPRVLTPDGEVPPGSKVS